jgi:hypothetical protein
MAGTDDRFAFDAPTYHDFAAGDGGGAEGEADAFFGACGEACGRGGRRGVVRGGAAGSWGRRAARKT